MIVTMDLSQKKMLGAWLTREKDHLLSMRALGRQIVIPGATGSLEVISNDLEMVVRLRYAIRTDGFPDILEADIESLIDIADENQYADREEFWRAIKALLEGTLNGA